MFPALPPKSSSLSIDTAECSRQGNPLPGKAELSVVAPLREARKEAKRKFGELSHNSNPPNNDNYQCPLRFSVSLYTPMPSLFLPSHLNAMFLGFSGAIFLFLRRSPLLSCPSLQRSSKRVFYEMRGIISPHFRNSLVNAFLDCCLYGKSFRVKGNAVLQLPICNFSEGNILFQYRTETVLDNFHIIPHLTTNNPLFPAYERVGFRGCNVEVTFKVT